MQQTLLQADNETCRKDQPVHFSDLVNSLLSVFRFSRLHWS